MRGSEEVAVTRTIDELGRDFYDLSIRRQTSQVQAGRLRLSGSGRLSLSVAGNVRGTLTNPAGSGKTILIPRVSVFGTATSWPALYLNPTTGLPGSAVRPITNGILGAAYPSVGEVRVDTSATTSLAGGYDTGIVIAGGGGTRNVLDWSDPLVLPEGVVLGMNVPFAGAADASFNIYWLEVDPA